MKDESISICIIAHNAYGVLAGVDTGHAGGIEVQTPLMARWLAENGYSVSMITWDEGIEDSGVIDKVKVIKLCKRDAGIRIVRFFHPRWTSFIKALRMADADVYYYNCGDLGLGQLVFWAKNNGKKVIYSVANERDCYRNLSHLTSFRDRNFYKYGLRRADKIIVQTKKQQVILEQEYNLDSVIVPMPSKGFSELARPTKERLSGIPRVLWVGRITPEKRLEWLLDVADACTDIIFDVVGSENQPSKYARDVHKRAEQLGNVILHGRVKHDDIGEYYSRSALLCSTSIYEGFPNVYLEAWSTGLPIVSTFDPDSVINANSLGKISSDVDSLIHDIRSLLQEEAHEKASIAAQKYYSSNHSVDSSMMKFADVFKSVIDN